MSPCHDRSDQSGFALPKIKLAIRYGILETARGDRSPARRFSPSWILSIDDVPFVSIHGRAYTRVACFRSCGNIFSRITRSSARHLHRNSSLCVDTTPRTRRNAEKNIACRFLFTRENHIANNRYRPRRRRKTWRKVSIQFHRVDMILMRLPRQLNRIVAEQCSTKDSRFS